MAINVGDKQVIDVAVRNEYALQAWLGDKLLWERDTTPPPEWVPPASDLTNTCDGPEGDLVTVENSAAGGDPWQFVNNFTYQATGMACDDTLQISNFRWDDTGITLPAPATLDVAQSVGFWFRVDTLHPGNGRIHDMRNTSNNATYGGVEMGADGRLRAVAGTTSVPESESPALVLGRRYWVTYGIDNSVAAGSHRLLIQTPTGGTVHDWSGPLAGTDDQIGFRRFGKVTTASSALWFGTVKALSGVSTGLPLEAPGGGEVQPVGSPAFGGSASAVSGGTVTLAAFVPTGGLELIVLNTNATDVITPAGWNLATYGTTNSGVRVASFWRIRQEGDPDTVDVTFGVATPYGFVACGYEGAHPTEPIGTPTYVNMNTNSVIHPTAELQTVASSSYEVHIAGSGSQSARYIAVPPGTTENVSTGVGKATIIAHGPNAAPTLIPASQFELNASQRGTQAHFEILPA